MPPADPAAARPARLPDDLLARSPEEGARLVALSLVAATRDARARLDDPSDAEALHGFRVNVRRLRSTLAAYRRELRESVGKKEVNRLRKAARATNAGRDLEVQIAWLDVQRARMYSRQRPGALWLRGRLAAAKRDADAAAAGAVGRKVERALASLARSLPEYTVRARVPAPGEARPPAPRFAAVLAQRIREGAAELGAGLAEAAAARTGGGATSGASGGSNGAPASDAHAASERAHDARLAAKRVRYLLMPVAKLVDGAGPVLAQLKALQDALGELHDLDVLAGVLEQAKRDAADEEAARAAEQAAAERADAEREAAAAARRAGSAGGAYRDADDPDDDAGAAAGAAAGPPNPETSAPKAVVPDAGAVSSGTPNVEPGAASGEVPNADRVDDGAAALAALAAPDVRPGLVALARRVAARQAALGAEVAATWLAGGGAALVAALDQLAAAAEAAHAGPGVEIERKYLLKALPRQLRGAVSAEVDQGWLPGERLRERVRRVRDARGERYVRTVKLGRGLSRVEVEEPCTRELFEALWPLTRERRVRKRRYRVPDGALVWEVDEFTDRALVLAEVELPAADAEAAVPSWLAPYVVREVTEEGEYVNANLARPADGDA